MNILCTCDEMMVREVIVIMVHEVIVIMVHEVIVIMVHDKNRRINMNYLGWLARSWQVVLHHHLLCLQRTHTHAHINTQSLKTDTLGLLH